MDIFDIFCKKIGYRKFSKREKILSCILILLLTEFLFYNFLIKKDLQKISELDSNNTFKEEVEDYNFKGFEDFSPEKLEKISKENNLDDNNFSKESQSDLESLYIRGKVNSKDLNNIKSFTDYYGYSNINLTRKDESTYTYNFKVEKPSKAIFYSDLKKAYFKENEISSQNKKDINKKKAEEKKNIEKIKNTNGTKNTKDKRKNPEIKKISSSKSRTKSMPKNKNSNLIKGHEEILSTPNKNLQLKETEDNNNLDYEDLEIEEHENLNYYVEDYSFVTEDGVDIKFYKDSALTSVFIDEKNLTEMVKLGLDRSCDGISLSLYFPYKACKEFGTINSYGEKVPFTGDIFEGQWFRVNLFQYDTSYIYFIPENDKDLFFFIKDVDFHEEI